MSWLAVVAWDVPWCPRQRERMGAPRTADDLPDPAVG